jgi:3-phenylpropionate/trans-cinnamate dioxygenase ferredoxin subunit
MGRWVRVANLSEVPPGQAKQVEVEGRVLALFNVEGNLYAIDNACTHVGGPLSEGTVEGDEVECPWHGARFSLKDGSAKSPPAEEGVSTYRVRVSGSDIEVELQSST